MFPKITVTHKKYGRGHTIHDTTGICRENELFVRFDNPLPFLKPSAIAGNPGGHHTDEAMYEREDIIQKIDLVENDRELELMQHIANTRKDIATAKELGDESWVYENVLKDLEEELKEWRDA